MTGRGLATAALVAVASCAAPAEAPPQPLPFNHALHATVRVVGEPLACTACHAGAERAAHASLPALATCLGCHMRPQGDPPTAREARVRAAAASGAPFHWIQVTRNPGHVYFSHRAHVGAAAMTCADCHGDVTRWNRPPVQPQPELTSMDACLGCHRERGAPTDCATCHQ